LKLPMGQGGVTRGFMTLATLWAEMTPLAGRAGTQAASLGAIATHRILVRAGVEITTQHRLTLDAREFRIVSIRDHDRSGRYIEIHAEEQVA